MKTVSFRHAAENLEAMLDEVCEEGAPIAVRPRHGSSAVLVSKACYASMEETLHLLSSSANAIRLLSAIEDIERRRNLVEHGQID